MAFATLEQLRQITNFKISDISDAKVLNLIASADSVVVNHFATKHSLEKLDGNIDSSNTYFYTKHSPIANITGANVSIIDACNATTGWTGSLAGEDPTAETGKQYSGSGALRLTKDNININASFAKTITETDFRNKRLKLKIYVDDATALAKLRKETRDIEIRLSDDSGTSYYSFFFGNTILKTGWHELVCNTTKPSLIIGTPRIEAITYITIQYTTNNATDTLTTDDILMDEWDLESNTVDENDVSVFLATYDSQNRLNLGNPVAVSAVSAREGRITLSSAPTTTTAVAGIFANYSHTLQNLNYNLLQNAANYMLAHLCSMIIRGDSPNFNQLADPSIRNDIAGNSDNWLRLSLSFITEALTIKGGIDLRAVQTNHNLIEKNNELQGWY